MKLRQWLALACIVLGVFIFNMSEFVPIGLLTGISEDFGISESSAGLIISIYAWAVAILSLPVMLVLRRMEYRRMMILCVVIFMTFQVTTGISATYGMLVVSRIGVAMSHAIFWSIAPPLAVRVVDEEYRKIALSVVSAGTSVAMIVGLPLGRVIGLAMGWRSAFVTISAITVVLLVMLLIVFPRMENPGTFTIRRLPEIFRNGRLVCIYTVLAIFITGTYCGYSYIEPFMEQVAHFSENEITVALIVFGFAGFIGGVLFAKVYDKVKMPFLVLGVGFVTLSLLLMNPASSGFGFMIAVCLLWGSAITCFNTSYQNEVIAATPEDATPIAMSLFSGIYNVGIAMGAIVGGAVIDHIAIDSIGFVGGGLGFMAMLIAAFVLVPLLKRSPCSKKTQ